MNMTIQVPVTIKDIERAEAILLGSMFLHPEMAVAVQAILQPEDFSQDRHRLIYETLLTVIGTPELDILQGVSILLTQDELERIDGVPYLSLLKKQAENTTISVEKQA